MALRVHRELDQGEGGYLGSADGKGGASVDVDLESRPRADPGHREVDDVVRRPHRGHPATGDQPERRREHGDPQPLGALEDVGGGSAGTTVTARLV